MSSKVAKFVEVIITARVIVDDDATETRILEAAKKRVQYKALNEYNESAINVHDDVDCPYDPMDPEDNPDFKGIAKRLGYTDKQMKEVLRSRGYTGLESKTTLSECAINMGFVWSFTHKRWLNPNAVVDDHEMDAYDRLVADAREDN